jgi:hypothetical protein
MRRKENEEETEEESIIQEKINNYEHQFYYDP